MLITNQRKNRVVAAGTDMVAAIWCVSRVISKIVADYVETTKKAEYYIYKASRRL